jgi:hypothetical protein
MRVDKLFNGGANGVDVLVLSKNDKHLHAVVRNGLVSLVSCCEPTDELFSAVETLGRVKHVFLLSDDAQNVERSAAWVKKYGALFWAPRAVTTSVGVAVDMILTAQTLLPFPGKVFVLSSVSEVVLSISQHQIVLAGSCIPTSSSDSRFESWITRHQESAGSLAKDFESMLVTLQPEAFLTQRSLLTRSQVIEQIVHVNKRGLLIGKRRPASNLRLAWFFLFLLNVVLFFLYLVSRGSSSK